MVGKINLIIFNLGIEKRLKLWFNYKIKIEDY